MIIMSDENIPRRLRRFHRNKETNRQDSSFGFHRRTNKDSDSNNSNDPFSVEKKEVSFQYDVPFSNEITKDIEEQLELINQRNKRKKAILSEIKRFKQFNKRMPKDNELDGIAENIYSELKSSEDNKDNKTNQRLSRRDRFNKTEKENSSNKEIISETENEESNRSKDSINSRQSMSESVRERRELRRQNLTNKKSDSEKTKDEKHSVRAEDFDISIEDMFGPETKNKKEKKKSSDDDFLLKDLEQEPDSDLNFELGLDELNFSDDAKSKDNKSKLNESKSNGPNSNNNTNNKGIDENNDEKTKVANLKKSKKVTKEDIKKMLADELKKELKAK